MFFCFFYNFSLQGVSCANCKAPFVANKDWMRSAGAHRYHLACFTCVACHRQLSTCETYHLVNGRDVVCGEHYDRMVNGDGEWWGININRYTEKNKYM